MKLYSSLKPEFIKLDCSATSAEEVLTELIHCLKVKAMIHDESLILDKLIEREKLGSTCIGNHSAVPHTKLKELKQPIICIGTSQQGIQYHESDKEPVHLIILILSPSFSPIIHLQILAAAASLIKKRGALINDLLAAGTSHELISVIQRYEEKHED
jgi:mannitol/fructose-specific phosphotransferase system IIA component (Ntr-type)